jgi:hypothetical protein
MKDVSTTFQMHEGKTVKGLQDTIGSWRVISFCHFPRILHKRQREAGSVVVNPYTPFHPTVIPTTRVLVGGEIFSNNLVVSEQLRGFKSRPTI